MTHTQSHQEEPLFEQGRRLARQREDLIAQGVDPGELLIPLAPDEHVCNERCGDGSHWLESDTPDLLASFRAYVRAAEEAHRAHMQYHPALRRGRTRVLETAEAERTAREAHETALREVAR